MRARAPSPGRCYTTREVRILPTAPRPALRTFGSGDSNLRHGTRGVGGGIRRALTLGALEALDALDADQALAVPEANEAHALGVTSEHGDLVHRGTHQRAGGADQHDLLPRQHLQRRHRVAVAAPGLQRDHPLAAAAVCREILEWRALAVAGGRSAQHLARADHDERDDLLSGAEADAAHPRRLASHVTHFALVEADRLAAARYQHDL